MKTNFNNQEFLKKLNPSVDLIKNIKTQRNGAIGAAVVLTLSIVWFAFVFNKNKVALDKIQVPASDKKKA